VGLHSREGRLPLTLKCSLAVGHSSNYLYLHLQMKHPLMEDFGYPTCEDSSAEGGLRASYLWRLRMKVVWWDSTAAKAASRLALAVSVSSLWGWE